MDRLFHRHNPQLFFYSSSTTENHWLRNVRTLLGALLVLSAFIPASSGYAEALRFTTLNSSDGLPQDSVRDIIQDPNGFMWFATEDGIARYDGQEIKAYRYDPDIPHPIPDNVATQFYAENNNRLWISIQGEAGISVLDQSNQSFNELKNTTENGAFTGNSGSAIFQRTEDEILFGTDRGVFSVAADSLTITGQLISESQFQNKSEINSLWEGPDKNLWIASKDGKLGYLSNAGDLTLLEHPLDNIIGVKSVEGIGDVLIGGRSGLFLIDYTQQQLSALFDDTFLNGKNVMDIVRSPDGYLWIATRSGLIRYDQKTNVAELAEKNPADENALPTNQLTDLYVSDDEILWIGTTDKGVIRTDLKDYGFISYSIHNLRKIYPIETDSDRSNSFKSNMIWSIFRDSRDTLWIGSSEGISQQNSNNTQFTNLTHIGTGDTKFDVSESWIMSIHETDGYLWFGTWGEGLLRYSTNTQEVTVFSAGSSDPMLNLSGDVIRLLLWDKERDSLWVGTHRNGLNQIDLTTGEISHYLPDSDDDNSFPHERSRALYLDNKNQLWVGSGKGLARFDDKENNFQSVDKFPDGETFSDVRGIHQTEDNTIWAANGYGLDKVNMSELKVEKRLLEKDGLSRSALYGIVADEQGKLWLPTTMGLTSFNPENNEFKRFFVDHNIQSNEFNFNARWKEKDGSVILGGTGGITKFNPEHVEDKYESKSPVILSVKAVDQNLFEESVLGVAMNSIENEFTLDPDQRSLIIDFTIPEYSFQTNIKYNYKLIGNDTQWNSADRRDIPIRYTNLPPGKYSFQVQAVDDSKESNRLLSIDFRITAYFWEKQWFKLLSLLVLCISLLHVLKIFHKQRLERNISQDRSNLYDMVVHELGPSLNRSHEDLTRLNANLSTNANDVMSDLHSENRYALSFVEQLRSLSTIEGYRKSKKREFLLEDIWDECAGSFGTSGNRIKIKEIPDVSILVFENSVQFVIRNLISNAIKYSGIDSPIFVSLQIAKKNLIIEISDHGFGIRDNLKEKILLPYERGDMYKIEGLGLGLTLVKNIASKYSGTVSITDNQPTGSKVTVILNSVVVIT